MPASSAAAPSSSSAAAAAAVAERQDGGPAATERIPLLSSLPEDRRRQCEGEQEDELRGTGRDGEEGASTPDPSLPLLPRHLLPPGVRAALCRGAIPMPLQAEFRRACQVCPRAVAAESPPRRFFLSVAPPTPAPTKQEEEEEEGRSTGTNDDRQSDDDDAVEAAWRLVQYWRYRCEAFGPRDAYQKLQGEGARNDANAAEDRRLLGDGGVIRVIVAPTNPTTASTAPLQSLVFFDGDRWSRLDPKPDDLTLRRCAFRLADQLLRATATTFQGSLDNGPLECVVVYLVNDRRDPVASFPSSSSSVATLEDGRSRHSPTAPFPWWLLEFLPVRVSRICVVPNPCQVQMYDFLVRRVPSLLHNLPSSLRSRVVPIVGDTVAAVSDAWSRQLDLDPTWDGLQSLLKRGLASQEEEGSLVPLPAPPRPHPADPTPSPPQAASVSAADLERALARLPDADQAAYRTARESAVNLVDRECPLRWFLSRATGGEQAPADAAARDLSRYWTNRRRVMGADAFLNPLGPSNDADADEWELSGSGAVHLHVLPSGAKQREPAVLALDLTRLPPGADAAAQANGLRRLVLRALHGALHRAQSHPVPLVLLQVLPVDSSGDASPNTASHIVSLAAEALQFPSTLVNVQAVHVVVPPPSALGPALRRALPLAAADDDVAVPPAWIHVAPTFDELLDRLALCGLSNPARLPSSVGGTWQRPSLPPRARRNLTAGVTDSLHTIDAESRAGPAKEAPSPRSAPPQPATRDAAAEVYGPAPGKADASGTGAWQRPTPQVEAKGLEELESAIALLPTEEKECLLRARRECPDRVEKESPPKQFLLVSQYNAWSAARRLANYWKERCDIFQDRAFLPLNQTGEGALSREDVAALRTGYYAVMRNDAHGRSVLLFDSSRRGECTPVSRLRVAIYVTSIVAENPKSQEEGFVVVALANLSLDSVSRRIARLIADALPLRMHSFHVAYCPAVGQKAIVAVATRVVLNVVGFLLGDSIQIHVGKSKEDIAAKLKCQGINEESLPRYLGGEWDHDELEEFNDLRIRYEWGLPSDSKRRCPHGVPDYVVKPRSDLTEEERIERKRRLNVLNSRRKRGRVRVEVEVLQSQVFDLQEQQRRLQVESNRLEGLLQDAQKCVEEFNESPPASSPNRDGRLPHPVDPLRYPSIVQFSPPMNALAGMPRQAADLAMPNVARYVPMHSAATASAALAAHQYPLAAALSALDNRNSLSYNVSTAGTDPRTSQLAQALGNRLLDDESTLSRHLVLSQMAQDPSVSARLALADWRNRRDSGSTGQSHEAATGDAPRQGAAGARQLPEQGFLGYWYR